MDIWLSSGSSTLLLTSGCSFMLKQTLDTARMVKWLGSCHLHRSCGIISQVPSFGFSLLWAQAVMGILEREPVDKSLFFLSLFLSPPSTSEDCANIVKFLKIKKSEIFLGHKHFRQQILSLYQQT